MMDTCQIVLFGDLTVSFEEELHQLLHLKDNGVLRSFLVQAGVALRRELGRLPAGQQYLFPRFTTIVDLVSKLRETEGAPVLRFALLSLCEIGQFIRYFDDGYRTYPSASNSYVLGLCTGSFAAAAVSASRSMAELVPAAVEAVIAAFRTALHSFKLRNCIEEPGPENLRFWSVVINVSESEAIHLTDTFSREKHLPYTSRPYVSAITGNNVTISGPPSVLEEFLATNSLRPHHLGIESPYHAPHLFERHDIDEVLDQFPNNGAESYHTRIPMFSAASDKILRAESYKNMLHTAVFETLCGQVRWEDILQACVKTFHKSTFKECIIRPFSSNVTSLVASTLSQRTTLNVKTEETERPTAFQRATESGRFEDSKIAVVGYSGRFPDAGSNEEFWDLLRAGRDVHRKIPEDRFNWETHVDPTGKTKNTSRVPYGCFINEPGMFDARFFNMSPRETENTDPAQRLAITTAYEAMEMAGMVPNRTPSTQQDRVGVFFGVTSDDWREVNSGQNVDTYFIPGGNRAFVPGRISYFLRLSGPSLSIDTACSSSFAAIQTACHYLWRGDCDTVIAGGTNVLTNPDNFAGLDRGHFLSKTGNCNAFDDAASGYCRADAVGSVILKRLEDAEEDNDPIFGVISGAFTNHCGQTDSITRPHEGDQASVFKRIIRHANANPLDVSYIEMHGTGTQAGDATEMNSVLSVFVPRYDRMPNYPLYIGSAKANIGHGESASGVSSLIKVLMMMEKEEIPPHCGIKTKINHSYPLDLEDRNVHIASTPVPWSRADSVAKKRLVFLNNFSAAGGNTAMLLEDAPVRSACSVGEDPRTVHPVIVSAKSNESLEGNAKALLSFLERNPDTSLADLSYTTTARRTHHSYRIICSESETKSVCEELRKKDYLNIKPVQGAMKAPEVVFVFTGQGTLYSGIGKQLFDTIAQFRADMLRFDGIARRQGFPSFLPLIDGSAPGTEDTDVVVAHLAITCVQIALTHLWRSWGVRPSSTIGHSLGEYAALHAAGVLTISDAIFLVGNRAQLLMRDCERATHAMCVVGASLNTIKTSIGRSTCSIACVNQPNSNAISGPIEEIDRLMREFQAMGVKCVMPDIPFAFHSPQVDPILEPFEKLANSIRFNAPSIPYVSPLLGRVVSDGATLKPSYLSQATRREVDFQAALRAAKDAHVADDDTVWLEIGSQPACSRMVKGTLGPQSITICSLKKGLDSWKVLTEAIETLFLSGVEVQWNEYHKNFEGFHRVLKLPRYSWELKNYWIPYRNDFCLTKGENSKTTQTVESKPPPIYISPSVQRVLEDHQATDVSSLLIESDIHHPKLAPVLQGHQVNGVPICPSTLYADVAMCMTNYILKKNNKEANSIGLDVSNMKVDKPLILLEDRESQLLRAFASVEWSTNLVSVTFYSVNSQGKKLTDHATCEVGITNNPGWVQDWQRNAYLINGRIAALNKSVNEGDSHKMKRGIVYKLFSALVDYDKSYRGIEEVVLDSNELEATAKVLFQAEEEGFYFNPRWIDSLGHIAGFVMNGNDNVQSKTQVFINHGWERMRCAVKFQKGKVYQTYNKMQLESGTIYVGNTYVLEEGNIVAIFSGVKFQGVPRQSLDRLLPSKPMLTEKPKTRPNIERSDSKPRATASVVVPVRTPPPQEARPATRKAVETDHDLTQTSANSTLSRVMAIISEEAGLDVGELQPASEFSDFGIDSLLSLTITGRLQEELDLHVQSSLFSEYPTVKDLSNFFQSSDSLLSSEPFSSKESQISMLATSTGSETCVTSASKAGDVMETVRMTIAEETGVHVGDIDRLTSFSSLGMDSLLSLNIIGKLAETLEMEIPQSLFSDVDNLDNMEKALGLNQDLPISKPPAVTATAGDDRPDPHSPPHATSVLLQGSPKVASKFLFLFPDGSGSATSYASLQKVSPNVVVYGLNCPWMKTPQDMICTVEHLTEKYLVEIRRRQPRGPYYFGGWSAGGICAYEAAQQLALIGEETARLVLLDSPNPIGLENPPQRMYDFFDSLNLFGTNGKAPPSWLQPHFNAFLTMLDDYKIQPFAGQPPETHMIYARDGICKHPSDPRPDTRPGDPREMFWLLNNRTDFSGAGWNELLGEKNLSIHVIDDVNHFSMVVAGPKIHELSTLIGRAVD